MLTDGPPGIGCPVIASLGGASALVIVAEPTVSGMHDMRRVAELAAHFKVPSMLCVNKFDLNIDQTIAIESLAVEKNIQVLGRIPFDPIFIKAMVQAQTIFEYNTNSKVGRAVKEVWRNISSRIGR